MRQQRPSINPFQKQESADFTDDADFYFNLRHPRNLRMEK
jgi:hypothetical protein